MAIKNEILEDFFSKSKNSFSNNVQNINNPGKNNQENSLYKKFRVFDDPTTEKENLSPLHINETGDKSETNRRQTEDKIDNKPETNRGQTGDKLDIQKTNRGQIGDRTEDKIEDKPRTNRRQTEDKLRTNCSFSSLVGLQRKIVLFIYESCRISINGITQPTSLQHIAERCKTTEKSAKKTIQRLEKVGGILRVEFKIGRAGWTRYSLPENVLQEIVRYETEDKLRTNRGQTEDKLGTELGTKSRTSSSSSSNDLIKTTTTNESSFEKNLNNFEDWKKVDLSPLTEVGFSQAHLLQIAKQNLIAPEVVQESIHAFAFDLTKNDKAKSLKKTPLDCFMGILRGGSAYLPPPNYKSPKEIALEAIIKKQNHIKALEEEAISAAFQNWVSKLTPDEKNRIIPEETKKMGVSGLMNQAIRAHFKENVWSSMVDEIML